MGKREKALLFILTAQHPSLMMRSWKNELAILLACKSVAEVPQMYLENRTLKVIPHFKSKY